MGKPATVAAGRTTDLVLATPNAASGDAAGLRPLPAEWRTIHDVVLDDIVIDHVVVGPNGVFTISIDPDPVPASVEWDGLYRAGVRVTTTVKSALAASHDLRRRVGRQLFAYPLLVTAIDDAGRHLDRLVVVPGRCIAEAIWSHCGIPLTRTQRMEAHRAVNNLSRPRSTVADPAGDSHTTHH